MKARLLTSLITAAMLLTVVSSPASPAKVAVKPSAEVQGSNVVLGDIALVESTASDLADRLRSTQVCTSPLPGRTRVLTRDQIITAMKRAGVYEDSVSLLCPTEISVGRMSAVVSGEAQFEAVREFALSAVNWPGTATVEVVRLPAEVVVPAGEVELRAKTLPSRLSKGRRSIPLEILVDGQVNRTVHVPVLIKLVAQVPVAVRPIKRAEEILGESYILQELDVTSLPDDVVTGKLEGKYIASVPISEGAVLRQNWISEPPVIRSGENVTVSVSKGMVRIAEKGVAAQDGRVGDLIKIRFAPGREVRGVVAGCGQVRISIDGRK